MKEKDIWSQPPLKQENMILVQILKEIIKPIHPDSKSYTEFMLKTSNATHTDEENKPEEWGNRVIFIKMAVNINIS